jgi:3-deoxy-D-manno-octulosonic-acid transferase
MDIPLAIYHRLGPLFARNNGLIDPAKPWPKRPGGQAVWLHAPRRADRGVVADLVARLSELRPDLCVLVTTYEPGAPPEFTNPCIHQTSPPDTQAATQAFLAHWMPDIAVWLSGNLRPAIIASAAACDTSLCLLDTGSAFAASRQWRFWPGLTRSTLRRFDTIISGDNATTAALVGAGAAAGKIQTLGVLETQAAALPCSEAERDALAKLLDTRPVWLAAGIVAGELEAVLVAHKHAMRRSHRLLLIIAPADACDAPEFAAVLENWNMPFAQRSTEAEPEAETQVYLADTEGELGLWYRLAPMTFVGQTLTYSAGAGPSPFDAAALGSVVLHGPALEPYQDAFNRLARAGASRLVTHSGELSQAVETLLAPDKAAEMAHAAWQICSAGAEVMDRVLDIITDALDAKGGDAR